MIKVIVSDLGGVVVNYNNHRVLDRLTPHSVFSRAEVEAVLFKDNDSPTIAMEKGEMTFNTFYHELIERLGIKISEAEVLDIWTDVFTLNQPVADLWARLRGDQPKIRLAALSNVDEARFKKCEELFGLTKRFDHLILSFREGARKPSHKIFEKVIERCWLIPEESLFVDDLAENVEAARQVGLKAVLYNQDNRKLLNELAVHNVNLPPDTHSILTIGT